MQPKKAHINDINTDLMLVYEVIKNNVNDLIDELSSFKNEAEYFYDIRNWDRDREKYSYLSEIKKAARFLYLNKTCYNGLYRVNNAGEFNSPFGSHKNPNIVNAPVLRAVSSYFNTNDITFSSLDYADVLKNVKKNTFVYLDPPYDPISSTSNFTGYNKGGFDRKDQSKLKECCDELNSRGVKFMLSNSSTDFIREQYVYYNITTIQAKRIINSAVEKRGQVDEVVIRNYDE